MGATDYWVIMLFSLVILVAGLSFGRKGGDLKTFFAAGGAVPWPISGLSLFMSFFSAGTFVVWGSIAYQYGWVAVTIQWSMCAAGFLVGFLLAPAWRKTGVLTAAEFIHRRFGPNVQKFYTYLFLFLSLGYTGAFLYPVAKIVNVSTGLDIEASILLLGSLIMVYTATGGLWAVVVTDVLQFVILTAAVLLVIPLALQRVDGWNNFVNQVPQDFFQMFSGEYTPAFVVAFGFYNAVFIGGNWAYVQRYTSVKNQRAARKVGYLFGALYLVSPVIWMIPPMLYRLVNPGLSGLETEGAYLLMCQEVLPVGMLGLMLGGMIFATASSVNTSLNLAAAVLTNDVYRNFKPTASPVELMRIARISTLIFGAGTLGVALLVPAAGGIVEVVLSIGAVTGGSLYAPPIWGLFSRRLTGRAILIVTGTSLLMNIFLKIISPLVFDFAPGRSLEMMVGVGLPLLLLSFNELYGKWRQTTSREFLQYNALLDSKPETEQWEKEEKRQNAYGIRVIALALAVISFLFLGLSLIAQKGILLLVILGGLILSLAVFMFLNSLKASRA